MTRPGFDTDDPVEVPADWKALPQTSFVWSAPSEGYLNGFAADQDIVAVLQRDSVVGLDRRTGRERWRLPAVDGASLNAHLASACGLVVVVNGGAVSGIRPADGTVAWTSVVEPSGADPGIYPPHVMGCSLVLPVGVERDSGVASPDVVQLDLQSGHVLRRERCGEYCQVDADDAHAFFPNDAQGWSALPLAGGAVRAVPALTRAIIGDIAITADGEAVRAYANGAELWSRPLARPHTMHPQPLLAHTQSTVVMLEPTGLTSIRVDDGTVDWHLPMSEELISWLALEVATHDAERLTIAAFSGAPVVLEVDLASGALISMRVMPRWPRQLLRVGDVLVARGDESVVALDMSAESPPIRSLLSRTDDVERSLEALSHDYSPHGGDDTPWTYPADYREAREWLARLAPELPELQGLVRARIASSRLNDAVALIPMLAPGPESDAVLLQVLERSWGPPTPERVRARVAVAGSLHGALPPAEAVALRCETAEWLALGRMPTPEATYTEFAPLTGVAAGRDLLERASVGPAPLAALRRTISEGRRAPSRNCRRTEYDLVLEAAIRHSFELRTSRYPLQAREARCESLEVAGRLIPYAPPSDQMPFVRFEIYEPPPGHDPLESFEGSRAWIGEGPFRFVHRAQMVGELNAEVTLLVLRRVGGEWRVLGTVLVGMS